MRTPSGPDAPPVGANEEENMKRESALHGRDAAPRARSRGGYEIYDALPLHAAAPELLGLAGASSRACC